MERERGGSSSTNDRKTKPYSDKMKHHKFFKSCADVVTGQVNLPVNLQGGCQFLLRELSRVVNIFNPEILEPSSELSNKCCEELSFYFTEEIMHVWEAFSNSIDPPADTQQPPAFPQLSTFAPQEVLDTLIESWSRLGNPAHTILDLWKRAMNNWCHSWPKAFNASYKEGIFLFSFQYTMLAF